MPLRTEPKQLQATSIYGIPGLDLSSESRLVSAQGMSDLVNFDLHDENGAAIRRKGGFTRTTLTAAATMVTELDGVLYAADASGTLFKQATSFDTGYGTQVTAKSYINQDDITTLYLASNLQMRKIRAGAVSDWGVHAPSPGPTLSATPSLGAAVPAGQEGPLSGVYGVVYTLVEKIGDKIVRESNPSVASTIVVTTRVINVTLGTASESNITHYRIYRTQDGGSSYLFEKEIPYVSNATTTLSIDDNDLGAAVDLDNNPPPKTAMFTIFRDRGWLSDGENLFYSKKFNLNAWPALNYLPIGTPSDPVRAVVESPTALGVFTDRRRFRIVESIEGLTAISSDLPFFGGSSNTFIPILSSSERGTFGMRSAVSTDAGIVYASRDGVFLTNLVDVDEEIGGAIRNIFEGRSSGSINPIHYSFRSKVTMGYDRSRIYVSYTESDDVLNNRTLIFSIKNRKWYSYDSGFTAFYSSNYDEKLYWGTEGINSNLVLDIDPVGKGADPNNAISASMETHRLDFGLPFVKKLLHYIHVDSDIQAGESITGTLYIDGTLDSTFTISDNHKVRFPSGKFGTDFKFNLAFSGVRQLKIRGVQFIWTAMRLS